MTQTDRGVTSDASVEESEWRFAVECAAKDLVAALSETPEFEAFEHAYLRFRDDERAQDALGAYQQQQRAIQTLSMLNAVEPEQRAELERLREAWMAEPAVKDYVAAQESLAAVSQAVDRLVSDHIGLDFASACRPSCCG